MASAMIVIPCRISPSRNVNPNGDWAVWPMTNNQFNPEGILLPDSVDTNVNFQTCERIPGWVHATVPNGVLRVYYVPGAASGAIKLFDRVKVVEEQVTDLDNATFSPDSNASQTVNAANRVWSIDFSLTAIAAALVPNRHVMGVIQRKAATDAADTLAASALLLGCALILDDTM